MLYENIFCNYKAKHSRSKRGKGYSLLFTTATLCYRIFLNFGTTRMFSLLKDLVKKDLRKSKCKPKVSGEFRSIHEVQFFAIILKFISATQKQKRNIVKSFRVIFFLGSLLPSIAYPCSVIFSSLRFFLLRKPPKNLFSFWDPG